jgi:D-alanyl-D-alanine carboxypeptidase
MRGPPLRLARRIPIALAAAIAMMGVPPALPAAGGGPLSVTLGATPTAITYGDQTQLSGAIAGDPSCQGPRTARLEWRRAGTTSWGVVTGATTAADGSFSFSDGQSANGSYRVRLPAAGSCVEALSDGVAVPVRVKLDATLVASSLVAGSCPRVSVTISPDKSGQNVLLQRLRGATWLTIQSLTLDSTSSASAKPCFGWEDIGVVHLRLRWPKQDPSNAAATSIDLGFRISKSWWMQKIDHLVAGHATSVSVGLAGSFLYQRADTAPRIPASNEKLLLSMALLDTFDPTSRIVTHAATGSLQNGVVQGNLWILGRGDPEITGGRMAALARQLVAAGVTNVRGRVMGAENYFQHDWWAWGWKPYRTRLYVAPPTALTFDGNIVNGRSTRHPEVLAARSLTKQLEKRGVPVRGKAGAGFPPAGIQDVAVIRSRTLRDILVRMDRPSDNFYAEVLGKLLGATKAGPPGTIAKGAAAITNWVAEHGADFTLYDSSGLSYANRVTARGIVRLLWAAGGTSWGTVLRGVLATGGQGTLEDRLAGVAVRAKTGTLSGVSALSGWVWLKKRGRWAQFSILSRWMPKWVAVGIEDRIVRILTNYGR